MVNNPVMKTFTVVAPTKAACNYAIDGQEEYSLDISCSAENSFFCDGSSEQTIPLKADSLKFTLHYGLSDSERARRDEYDRIVNSVRQDVEEVFNNGKEISSYYDNFRTRALVPTQIDSRISAVAFSGSEAYERFQDSQDRYRVLELDDALDELSGVQEYDLGELKNEITILYQELAAIQERHNGLVRSLTSTKDLLLAEGKQFQRLGMQKEYFSLLDDVRGVQEKITLLSFSSYDALEQDIDGLAVRSNVLLTNRREKARALAMVLDAAYLAETTKLGSPTNLLMKDDIEDTLAGFCSAFRTTLLADFQEHNRIQEGEANRKNLENTEWNDRLLLLEPQWKELTQIVEEMRSLAVDRVFDPSLVRGCDVSMIGEQYQIENALANCRKQHDALLASIAANEKPSKRFVNFFKFIFVEKPVLEQQSVPALSSLMRPIDIAPVVISFDATTEALVLQQCEFVPVAVHLESISSIGDVEYERSNVQIDFSALQGECEKLDCYNDPATYPILFVHGHLFKARYDPMIESRYTFDKMIPYFAKNYDGMYDAGTIVDEGSEFLDKGIKNNPHVAMFRTTYYGNAYIDASGGFQFQKKNYESISAYAQKLDKIIDATLATTGRKKVKIVAHSMGGLVAREYLRIYGSEKVEVFVMIGTPNDGVVGMVRDNCISQGGAEVECKEMATGSDFLMMLKQGDALPAKTYTITGRYANSNTTDAIVLADSVKLDGVENFDFYSQKNYNGAATFLDSAIGFTTLVHSDLVDPSLMPGVSQRVAQLLE
jgi:hypothetical protein